MKFTHPSVCSWKCSFRSSAVLFEVQRFWARNMNPTVHTGNNNSNSNSNSNSSSNINGNGNGNGNGNNNIYSNSNSNHRVSGTAVDTEGATSARPDARDKGLRARAGQMLSRRMPSFKRKEPSATSTASEAASSDVDGTAAPVSAPSMTPQDAASDASSLLLQELSYNDAMTALGRREKERLQDKSWVLIPALAETEPCRRCGQLFDADDNDSNACAFHADRDGKPGEYRRVAVRNGTGGNQNARLALVKMWTCCHNTEENCPGCFSRPHICKDVMVSVRALGAPTMRIENIEMSVLRALEISIFPGAMTSWLQVHTPTLFFLLYYILLYYVPFHSTLFHSILLYDILSFFYHILLHSVPTLCSALFLLRPPCMIKSTSQSKLLQFKYLHA